MPVFIFWSKENVCLFVVENYLLSLLPSVLRFFSLLTHLFCLFAQKAVERELVILLPTNFRFFERKREGLVVAGWKHEHRLCGFRVMVVLQGWIQTGK